MSATTDFHDQVIGILPKLRVQALALTRNRAAAEDLVQDAVCKRAVGAVVVHSRHELFGLDAPHPSATGSSRTCGSAATQPISTTCRRRPSRATRPHEDRLALKDLGKAMTRLPADQREALVMVVVHGMSYEALAEATGCAVGTAKSRVFRARRQLEAWLMGEKPQISSGARRARPAAVVTDDALRQIVA